jgi:hypothetical protein
MYTSVALWLYGNWKLSFLFSKDSFLVLCWLWISFCFWQFVCTNGEQCYNICDGRSNPTAASLGYYTKVNHSQMSLLEPFGTICSKPLFDICLDSIGWQKIGFRSITEW